MVFDLPNFQNPKTTRSRRLVNNVEHRGARNLYTDASEMQKEQIYKVYKCVRMYEFVDIFVVAFIVNFVNPLFKLYHEGSSKNIS